MERSKSRSKSIVKGVVFRLCLFGSLFFFFFFFTVLERRFISINARRELDDGDSIKRERACYY